jgi:uncharacterized protein
VNRRQFLAGSAAALTTLVVGGRSVAEAYDVTVERWQVGVPRLAKPLRVAFLTDLHLGPFIAAPRLRRWVELARSEAPDLVVLGGDLVDAHGPTDPNELAQPLAPLEAPLGCFTVWGNHDHRRFREAGGLGALDRALHSVGIRPLRNEGVVVRDDLFLAGLDDLRNGRPDLRTALAGRGEGRATLFVSHNPDVLPEVPLDVDLTLCGHTHGGQIRLPGIGAVVTSSRYGRRFVAGWVAAPARGYVSRGLGVGVVPMRLDCPPELTVLDLVPAASASEVRS